MKKIIVVSYLSLTLGLYSCVDLSAWDIAKNEPKQEAINTDFIFSTRTPYSLNILAKDANGNPASNIKFSVYADNPSNSDGGINIGFTPMYQGYTDKNGTIYQDIQIPDASDTVFVYPDYLGYGYSKAVLKQDLNQQIVFEQSSNSSKSASTKMAASMKREAAAPIERSAIEKGKNYYFCSYFTEGKGNELDLATGKLNIGNGVVSFDDLTDKTFTDKVNEYFPEASAYTKADLTKSTDLVISKDGTKVYVSYIGDGGFCTSTNNRDVYNALYYYTYTENNIPNYVYKDRYTKDREKPYHLTAIFPNVHPNYIKPGTKVQLLFFDESKQKYVEGFPAGTHIGFDLNFRGYNKNDTLGFSINYLSYQYFSTPALNGVEKNGQVITHGIIQKWDDGKCFILGMERAGYTDLNNVDMDYNDILAKITIDPWDGGNTSNTITGSGIRPAATTQKGILAFEDKWPNKGDYDFNDFVTEYTYSLIKDNNNKVNCINLDFSAKAIGAMSTNGFGIILPVKVSDIDFDNLGDNVVIENRNADDEDAVIIVYDDVRNAFGGQLGYINTVKGVDKIESTPIAISIPLKNSFTESNVSTDKFNPFLFAGSREHEIHLVDKTPSSKADLSLFGTGVDRTDVSKGIYYRMNNTYPWAIDVSDTSWKWPYENISITSAYLDYSSWYDNWVQSNGTQSSNVWYKKVESETTFGE